MSDSGKDEPKQIFGFSKPMIKFNVAPPSAGPLYKTTSFNAPGRKPMQCSSAMCLSFVALVFLNILMASMLLTRPSEHSATWVPVHHTEATDDISYRRLGGFAGSEEAPVQNSGVLDEVSDSAENTEFSRDVSEGTPEDTPQKTTIPVDSVPLPKNYDPINEEQADFILSGTGAVYGKVQKGGMLPIEKWHPPLGGRDEVLRPINSWLWSTVLGSSDIYGDEEYQLQEELGEMPPKAGLCTLLFNPIYKFIVIKNTKVAGTSLLLKFGGFCEEMITLEEAEKAPNCLWRVTDMTAAGIENLGYANFEELWADYTVFSLVRNPYDRAGSSYDYIVGMRQDRADSCRDPSFKHFTAKPYVLGLQDMIFGCGDSQHDFYHVEPQHTCLLDDSSNMVVDYIARVDSLDEDLAVIFDAINSRRKEGTPPLALEGGIGWAQRGPIADEQIEDAESTDSAENDAETGDDGKPKTISTESISKSRHANKYMDCGSECVVNVNKYYKTDFEILKYPVHFPDVVR